ncbi:hypothetical protein F4859DRAFT_136718 [Xylaria cf. heliscus]|nr:hypothetical protein F4859DRAFT_136718 [Xylaria cf. heliscus]
MDPLTALGLAGNVITFIDFTNKFVSKTVQVYQSVDGASKDAKMIENVTRDFIFLVSGLSQPAQGSLEIKINPKTYEGTVKCLVGHSTILSHCIFHRNSTTDPIARIAVACSAIAQEIIDRLEKMKRKNENKIWSSLKLALQELYHESELENLNRTLSLYKQELGLHILLSLRENINIMSSRQVDQFDSVKTCVRDEIRAMLQQTTLLLKSSQTATSLAPESVAEMSHQHEQTRKEIIDAINHALHERDMKPLDLSALERPSAIEEAADKYSSDLLQAEKELLDSLKFPVMLDREEEIPDAEKATFKWIFESMEPGDLGQEASAQGWDNFPEWLHSDKQLYWITGKAGSGKSTLMKYLFCKSRTRSLLRHWAGSHTLAIAGFFFWNTGSVMQKTQEGLLRSLIYQVLSMHRELIPTVLQGVKLEERDATSGIWTTSRLRDAFGKLIKQDTIRLKMFFFIDGLDEYNGDHKIIAGMLKEVALVEGVRVCLSSRPLLVFERAFEGFPQLMLQNLTFRDISTYVTNKFNDNALMLQLQNDEPQLANRLSAEIVSKASGVFLWVKLVVRSLLEGLESYDRGSDLERRLRELPEDLEELYWHMLQSVKPAFYLEQASKLLQIVYRANKPFTLLQLAYADLEDPNSACKAAFNGYTEDEKKSMCTFMEGRLKSRCLGLIEIGASSSVSRTTAKTVQFMHQSVADFLETMEVQSRMAQSLRSNTFSPYLCLMRAEILQLKNIDTGLFPHRQPAVVIAEMWYRLAWAAIESFISYARREESQHGGPQTELIDELDKVAAQLFKLYVTSECRFDIPTEIHWSERRRDGKAANPLQLDGTIISFALESGLYQYAAAALGLSGSSKRTRKLSKPQIKYALLAEEAAAQKRQDSPPQLREQIREKMLKTSRFRLSRLPSLGPLFGLKKDSDSLESVTEMWKTHRPGRSDNTGEPNPKVEGNAARDHKLLSRTAFG